MMPIFLIIGVFLFLCLTCLRYIKAEKPQHKILLMVAFVIFFFSFIIISEKYSSYLTHPASFTNYPKIYVLNNNSIYFNVIEIIEKDKWLLKGVKRIIVTDKIYADPWDFSLRGKNIEIYGLYDILTKSISVKVAYKEDFICNFYHELGHHFYRNYLNKSEKKEWEQIWKESKPETNYDQIMNSETEGFAESFASYFCKRNTTEIKYKFMKKVINNAMVVN